MGILLSYLKQMEGVEMKKRLALVIVFGILTLVPSMSAQTWTAAKRLTWNPGYSAVPNLAADANNHIHLVWEDDSKDGNYEIFHKRSTDGGATWSKFKRLTWNSGWSSSPVVSTGSINTIHVVWSDEVSGNREIYYKRSTNGGVTWGSSKRLTFNPGNSIVPVIAIDSSDNIYLLWSDDSKDSNYEIYLKKSTNGGATWSSFKRLTWNSGASRYPAIAIDSSNKIHVAWQDSVSGPSEIFYKQSTNGGTTWTTKRLTYNSGFSSLPAIAVDSSDNIQIAWEDSTPGNSEIFLKRSTDGGVSWSGIKRLTWNVGESYEPEIAVDSNNAVHVVWYDATPGNNEIFHKRSTNGGVMWDGANRLTWDPDDSLRPAIAADSNDTVHVVWQDDTTGNNEIHYKKGIK